MPKAIIHTATGEFRDEQGRTLVEGLSQGWTEAGCPPSLDGNFSIVIIPAGIVPDRRRHRWSGSAVVSRTLADIQADDANAAAAIRDAQIRQRLFFALAVAVHKRFKRLIPTDTTTAAEWEAAIRNEWDALS